jgi:hypothetical protein
MKRSDLVYIAAVLQGLKPDARTAPVIQTTEWRRVVVALGRSFRGTPWAHLYAEEAWLADTDAATPEPSPRENEPYELEGAWYNLTESEGLARGLVQDPSAPRWLTPRNLGPDGSPIVDRENGQILDAVSGEWRTMTPAEVARYPAPVVEAGTPGAPPRDAWEGLGHIYCYTESPHRNTRSGAGVYVCTRPAGHAGIHEAVDSAGTRYCAPWNARPSRPAPVPVPVVRTCGDEYEDEDGDIHNCTEVRGHDDDQSRNYDPDLMHSDGDITW